MKDSKVDKSFTNGTITWTMYQRKNPKDWESTLSSGKSFRTSNRQLKKTKSNLNSIPNCVKPTLSSDTSTFTLNCSNRTLTRCLLFLNWVKLQESVRRFCQLQDWKTREALRPKWSVFTILRFISWIDFSNRQTETDKFGSTESLSSRMMPLR